MREYKTKATALKHLSAGENFTNKVFGRYWTDREVCMEVLAREPKRFYFIKHQNPEIEWDSDFMASAFLKMVDLYPDQVYYGVQYFGKYLPPEITNSKDVVLRCAEIPNSFIWDVMAPSYLLDKEVCKALNVSLFFEPDRTSSPESARYEQEEVAAKIFQAFPHLYLNFLDQLCYSRSFAAMFCSGLQTFRFAFHGLHDDEEFVLEVLKKDTTNAYALRHECSYRIRKEARHVGLMKYLETVVQARSLGAMLTPKTGDAETRTKSQKV